MPFSFAPEQSGLPQPVNVTLGRYQYPGEVIVARQWQANFGQPLSGVSMFRLVLLNSGEAPESGEIDDPRICVAAIGPASAERARPHAESVKHELVTPSAGQVGGLPADGRLPNVRERPSCLHCERCARTTWALAIPD